MPCGYGVKLAVRIGGEFPRAWRNGSVGFDQYNNQTDAWEVANNGATDVFWVQGAGAWNGPLQI